MRKWLSLFEMYRARLDRVKQERGKEPEARRCPSVWSPTPLELRHRRPTRGFRLAVVLALAGIALAPGGAVGQCPPLDATRLSASSPVTAPACRFDATLTRLFTPPAAPAGTYRVYVAGSAIETVAAAFKAVAQSDDVSGAWVIQETDPQSAFGDAGPYNRTKVARLYVGVPTRVARGPVVRDGRTRTSITLVSPYPEPSLARLERGTLIIEFRPAPLQ